MHQLAGFQGIKVKNTRSFSVVQFNIKNIRFS